MQAIRSSWRAPLLSRFKHTQSSNNPAPADLLAEVNRSRRRSADSASSSKASLPTPQDLLALRPRLKRQRRRTDTEWAHEYARKFQAGIGSIERAFTLPQLEHLAKELQLQVHGQHASYRKRELATQLVKSAEGWGWGDPQALLDKVKKKSNVPPHKQGASTSTLSAFPINKKFNHLGGTDVDLSPAELFLSWPTVHRVAATVNVHSMTMRNPGQPVSRLHLAGFKEDVDSVIQAVQQHLKSVDTLDIQLPQTVEISNTILQKVSLQSLAYVEKVSPHTLRFSFTTDSQRQRAERLIRFLIAKDFQNRQTAVFTSASEANRHRFVLLPATLTSHQAWPWWIPPGLQYRVNKIKETAQLPFLLSPHEDPILAPATDSNSSLSQILQPSADKVFTATFGQLTTPAYTDLPADTLPRTLDLATPLHFLPGIPEHFLQLSTAQDHSSSLSSGSANGPSSIKQLRSRMSYYRTKSTQLERWVYLPPEPTQNQQLVLEKHNNSDVLLAFVDTIRSARVAIPERSTDLELETKQREPISLQSIESPTTSIDLDGVSWSLAHHFSIRETRVLDPTTAPSESTNEAGVSRPFDWLLVQSTDKLTQGTTFASRTQCLQLRLSEATGTCIQDSIAMVHALQSS